MKKVLVIVLLVMIAAFGWILRGCVTRGRTDVTIEDVTKLKSYAVRPPIFPFRNGALFVEIEGYLDGDAKVLILTHHGGSRRAETISGTFGKRRVGGAEEWADDLTVLYQPGTAKLG